MRRSEDHPNILLINCDDLGYGDLGCYGSANHDTPAIDRLAAEGQRFTSFYAGAPVCTPSRASLLTGCLPRRVGMHAFDQPTHGSGLAPVLFPGMAQGLDPHEGGLAATLAAAGYATGIFGKWHLGDQPDFLPGRHGFAEVYGLPYSNDMGPIDAKPDWPPLPLMQDGAVVEQNPDLRGVTARFVERTVLFLRRHRDRPFFAYLAHVHPHVPNYAPEEFARRSRNGLYGAAVAEIDWSLAVLRTELRRLDLERNTIILFTSDNGAAGRGRRPFLHVGSNLPLRGTKGSTWDGGQRVPLIVWGPGLVAPGTCDGLTTMMDLLPSLAALAGTRLTDDRQRDGRDLSSRLRGGAIDDAGVTFPYYKMGGLEALRDRRYKLHLGSGALYDLAADPGEAHDCAAAHPETVRALRAAADTWRGDLGDDLTGAAGTHCRPCGRVTDPQPLTVLDPTHPYAVALYDLDPSRPGLFARAQPFPGR